MRLISLNKWNPAAHLFCLGLLGALASGCVKKGSTAAPGQNEAGGSASPAASGGNLIKNADFSDGTTLPWTSSFSEPARGDLAVGDGAACLRIDTAGVNKWDAQVRHREMVIQNGHTYSASFRVWADKASRGSVKVGMSGPPYSEYWNDVFEISLQPQVVRGEFVMKAVDDATAEFAVHLGGGLLKDVALPITVCIDDVQLTDPQFTPPLSAGQHVGPTVRVNQLGYFPGGRKLATVASSSEAPLDWQLKLGQRLLAYGKTAVLGPDKDSGENLHSVDFTAVSEVGKGYVLTVGDAGSYPFDIGSDLYAALKYDALKYFYHNRSGIEIKMPFAGQAQWARPAGHAASDKSAPCAPDAGCKYSLDASKGWYDAGDHGKYVVNGGISVWTLMNQFERFSALGDVAPFADGKLNLPESGNGVPDLLDEARWELEFMLGMQVPKGQPKAGMVHHKLHDVAWTALGLAPHEAELAMKRNLRPVSTAATLNLAAAAAQGARLFRTADAKFASRCLQAAESAWLAAKQFPAIYAPASDGDQGGGPYDDPHVEDDFFWAASELYVTTKKPLYHNALTDSKYLKELTRTSSGVPVAMTWADTDALGTITLALVPGALGAAEQKVQRDKLVVFADELLAVIETQGYRFPFSSGTEGKYPWGSNSFVLNNALVLAYAYDFTKADKYLEGVITAMDYLLGRNALAQSYVTGYGEWPLVNPHHRFWAHQANAKFPAAPPGAVSGGPNSSLQDPYAKSAGLPGCAPQKCFVDNIEAWSVNEITINWNAPLAWVAAFLDENGKKAAAAGK